MLTVFEVQDLSRCSKRKVGCIVRQGRNIISYGMNHGYDEQCSCSMTEKNPHCLHAEQMALSGTDFDVYVGATLETTYAPCINCAVLISQRKIAKVIYHLSDKCGTGIKYLIEHNVEVELKC